MTRNRRSWRSVKLQQLWRLVRESHENPLEGTPQPPPAVATGDTAITFIGHSSFLIQTAGQGLLVDPVFATRLIVMRRQRRPGVRVRDLPRIDAVLLTHAHMDHLNRPSLRAITREMRRRNLPAPIAIVPNDVSDLVRTLGFREVRELRWWDTTELSSDEASSRPEAQRAATLSSRPEARSAAVERPAVPATNLPGSLTITATPCKHWGARMFKDTHRGFGGYVLQSAGSPTIYHSGDTAYFNGFHEIGDRLHPDIALLPIGAYFPDSYRAVHTSPEEALQIFMDVHAETMIPMHFNTFRLGREPMTEPLPRLLAAAERAGLRDHVHPLAEGESLLVPASQVAQAQPELAAQR